MRGHSFLSDDFYIVLHKHMRIYLYNSFFKKNESLDVHFITPRTLTLCMKREKRLIGIKYLYLWILVQTEKSIHLHCSLLFMLYVLNETYGTINVHSLNLPNLLPCKNVDFRAHSPQPAVLLAWGRIHHTHTHSLKYRQENNFRLRGEEQLLFALNVLLCKMVISIFLKEKKSYTFY